MHIVYNSAITHQYACSQAQQSSNPSFVEVQNTLHVQMYASRPATYNATNDAPEFQILWAENMKALRTAGRPLKGSYDHVARETMRDAALAIMPIMASFTIHAAAETDALCAFAHQHEWVQGLGIDHVDHFLLAAQTQFKSGDLAGSARGWRMVVQIVLNGGKGWHLRSNGPGHGELWDLLQSLVHVRMNLALVRFSHRATHCRCALPGAIGVRSGLCHGQRLAPRCTHICLRFEQPALALRPCLP